MSNRSPSIEHADHIESRLSHLLEMELLQYENSAGKFFVPLHVEVPQKKTDGISNTCRTFFKRTGSFSNGDWQHEHIVTG
ncbi:hypothetical protein CG478_001150 [Bacillus cytotoxicus]|nr:hypothetical protein CG480_001150 [Bacillus cytotoxicus]AWC47213.1 hypothetical protein CG478_001150 [Bacillus cytotoxicus]AWC51234.1 hypothetical protein CG477_001150 [Bacillus cytotoxicus]AWC55363.1 hypothetical protein CG476_001150 [Bacillus cytotoxicus]AWC63486.1 hypothetical protein CG475_001150 [Bacillus cytotoxicus]